MTAKTYMVQKALLPESKLQKIKVYKKLTARLSPEIQSIIKLSYARFEVMHF